MDWKFYSEFWEIASDNQDTYNRRFDYSVGIVHDNTMVRISSMVVDYTLLNGKRIFGQFSFHGCPISHGIWDTGGNPASPLNKNYCGWIVMTNHLKNHLIKLKEVKPDVAKSIDDCIDFLSTPWSDNKYKWRDKK